MQDKNVTSNLKRYKYKDTVTEYPQLLLHRYYYRVSIKLHPQRYGYKVPSQICKELLETLPYKYFKDIMENITRPYPLYSLVLVQLSFTAFLIYECSFELIIIGSLSYAPGFVFLFVVITFPE